MTDTELNELKSRVEQADKMRRKILWWRSLAEQVLGTVHLVQLANDAGPNSVEDREDLVDVFHRAAKGREAELQTEYEALT